MPRLLAVSLLVTVTLSATLLSTNAYAQQDTNADGQVDVLVPITMHGGDEFVRGAYGSKWGAELWLNNASDFDLGEVQRGMYCPIIPHVPCTIRHPSGQTTQVSPVTRDMNRGAVFSFDSSVAESVTLSARLLELSRRAQPNGIELPIVWEDSYLQNSVRLIAIPQREDARVALRVYDPRGTNVSVRVELMAPEGEVIGETILNAATDPDATYLPGYAGITDLLNAFPQLFIHNRFDLRITPLTVGAEYYAVVSVTDRDTQHVLLITPDR